MKKSPIGLIAAFIFALITAGSFFWLWTISQTGASSLSTSSAYYTIIEIESVKKEAANILSGLDNVSAVPIAVPTDKMGRTNPFTDY